MDSSWNTGIVLTRNLLPSPTQNAPEMLSLHKRVQITVVTLTYFRSF